MPDDLDFILRSHLASRLDRQRGRAGAAFDAAVLHPATIALARRHRSHPLRTVTGVGLALAASMAIGFTLPALLNSPAGGGGAIGLGGGGLGGGGRGGGSGGVVETTPVADGPGIARGSGIAGGMPRPRKLNRTDAGDGAINTFPGTNVQHSSWYSTIDDGGVMINPTTPGRVVRLRRAEQITWTDADGQTHVQVVPMTERQWVVQQPTQ